MHGWWFFSFWWLIFPIMGFVFGGFSMWMGYRAHKDRLELLKAYIAQGSAWADCTTSAEALRSAFRSTRAVMASPSRKGST